MEKPRTASPGRQAAIVLVASVAITLAMFLIPSQETAASLLAPFRWLHIYVHEFGHGIAALMVGGHFDKFEMYSDWGQAHVAAEGALRNAFVCAGGLCGPAVVGGIFLAMGRNVKWARIALAAFGAFMVVSLVLWTRTPFGWGFGAVVALISLAIAFKGTPGMAQVVLVFVGVQLALSVYTGGGYLFMRGFDMNGVHHVSDTEAMANALGLPYWFWGGACAVFSAIVLLLGLTMYIRQGRSKAARNAMAIAV